MKITPKYKLDSIERHKQKAYKIFNHVEKKTYKNKKNENLELHLTV